LLAACENDDEVGKIRRPPSPLALPRGGGVDKSTEQQQQQQQEQQQQQQQREKRKKPRSRERKKEDTKLLRAQTVDTKGERAKRRKTLNVFKSTVKILKKLACLWKYKSPLSPK